MEVMILNRQVVMGLQVYVAVDVVESAAMYLKASSTKHQMPHGDLA
jgi:hypothetical protein